MPWALPVRRRADQDRPRDWMRSALMARQPWRGAVAGRAFLPGVRPWRVPVLSAVLPPPAAARGVAVRWSPAAECRSGSAVQTAPVAPCARRPSERGLRDRPAKRFSARPRRAPEPARGAAQARPSRSPAGTSRRPGQHRWRPRIRRRRSRHPDLRIPVRRTETRNPATGCAVHGIVALDDPANGCQDLFHGRFTRYAWLSHTNPRCPQKLPAGTFRRADSRSP